MTKLEKLYSIIENSKDVGVKQPKRGKDATTHFISYDGQTFEGPTLY